LGVALTLGAGLALGGTVPSGSPPQAPTTSASAASAGNAPRVILIEWRLRLASAAVGNDVPHPAARWPA
jgi:hypothetical protein